MCLQVIGANVTPKIPSELSSSLQAAEGMVGGKNFPREAREEETSEAEIDMEVSIAVVVWGL